LLTIVSAGILVGVALIFWADLQNWMAGVIERAHNLLGPTTHTVQSALVILDRVMVNGQRMISAAGRTMLVEKGTQTLITTEEVRQIDPQALPPDVLKKLDSGQVISYEISTGSKPVSDE
jgi:hypothetical protein